MTEKWVKQSTKDVIKRDAVPGSASRGSVDVDN